MAFEGTFEPPSGVETDEFLLRPLRVSDAELDYEAVMESKDFLRVWEQSTWPTDDFTVDANRQDMEKMVSRFKDRHSFGYTMMNLEETECLGCVYVNPTDVNWLARNEISALGDAQWADYDIATAFWVRTSRLTDALDQRLLETLRRWLADEWPGKGHLFVVAEALDQQIALFESAGLQRVFRLADPSGAEASLAFA